MLPPVFTTLQASADVRALLGARPRVYRFGEAPENETRPYGVWQLISGVPENTLSESPAVDRDTVQLDIYATTDAEVVAVATACRDQLETVTHMTAFRSHPREPATRLFRIGMDFDFWLARES